MASDGVLSAADAPIPAADAAVQHPPAFGSSEAPAPASLAPAAVLFGGAGAPASGPAGAPEADAAVVEAGSADGAAMPAARLSATGQVLPLSWPLAAAQQAGAAYAPQQPAGPQSELRTAFIVGFPSDVKIRELHNLLKFLPGYEACQFHNTYPSPTGFALFASRAHALDAISLLNGDEFDDGVFLRAEPARKNLFLKPNDPTIRFAVRSRGPELLLPPASLAPLTPEQTIAQGLGVSSAAAGGQAGALAAGGSGGWLSLGFAPVTNLNDNPPCNMLFIGNLCNEIDEMDLRAVMEPQPGFKHLQLNDTGKGKVCFVEFVDVPSAAYVHETLQGVQVPSNGRGGLRIQYSRNPFGQRRNVLVPQQAARNGGRAAGLDGGARIGAAGGGAFPMAAMSAAVNGIAAPGMGQLLVTGGTPVGLHMPGMGGAAGTALQGQLVAVTKGPQAVHGLQGIIPQGSFFGGGGDAVMALMHEPHIGGAAGMGQVAHDAGAMATAVAQVTHGMASAALFGGQLSHFAGF